MIDWPLVLIVLIAVVVLGGLLGLAAWWYLPPVDLSGLVVRLDRSNDAQRAPQGSTETSPRKSGHSRAGEANSDDDDWADQLHEINQLGKFGDLTRPVAHLTHYEVEALIRELAVPEWVPDRYRTAA